MTQQMIENVTENNADKSPVGIENTNSGTEKLFTQKELEDILSERLKRERKTTKSLTDVKKFLKLAVEKGLVNGNSYCEMAEDLCKKLDTSYKNEPEETFCEQTGDCTDDANANEILEEGIRNAQENAPCTDEQSDASATIVEDEKSDAQKFAQTLSEIRESFSDENIGALLSGGLFENFAKGRQGNVIEVFGDFCSFMRTINNNQNKEVLSYDEKNKENSDDDFEDELCSTAFSSHSSNATSYQDGLTKQQMDIAKSAGMSYREYANLLESIPKNKTRKSYGY